MSEKPLITPTAELHILRHFSSVSESYAQTLLGKSAWEYCYDTGTFEEKVITEACIAQALQTVGSKFLEHVPELEHPRAVLEYIAKEMATTIPAWKEEKGMNKWGWISTYPHVVGKATLISVESLTDIQRTQIQLSPRGSGNDATIVQIISGVEAPMVQSLIITIIDTPALPCLFATAYPGVEIGPDFPHGKQTTEAYQESQRYWTERVFVV